MSESICSFPPCGNAAKSRDLCSGHYQQERKGQSLRPLGVRVILSAEERFWPKVRKADGCWQWIGARGGHTYGNFWDGTRTTRAHTFAFETVTGQKVPAGMHLDHLCRNHLCVNPAHLEVVTPLENTQRGVLLSIMRYRNIDMTHCKHGHPLSGDNLYVQPKNGYRYCQTCKREAKRRLYWRKRDGRDATQPSDDERI